MTRLRALGYGVLVAVVVFYWLAVPTLRDIAGPVVVLPAYAAVAVLAGAVTYRAITHLAAREGAEDGAHREAAAEATTDRSGKTGSAGRPDSVDVEGIDRRNDQTVDELLEDLEAGREE